MASSGRYPRRGRMALRAAMAVAGAGAVLALGILAALARWDRPSGEGPLSRPGEIAHGVRTSLYGSDRLQARVSAASIAIKSPRIVGPFRLGFLRAVTAGDVTVEAFEEKETNGEEPPNDDGGAEPIPFLGTLARLFPSQLLRNVAEAEVDGLRFRRRRGDRVVFEIEADRCWTSVGRARLVCGNGWVRDERGTRSFREARYGGAGWVIHDAQPEAVPKSGIANGDERG